MFNNSQPHKPAKPQIALPMPVFEAPRKIRSLVNSRSVHPQFFTMIHRDHACCEQHRCLDYSSSTQTGCVSNETALFFFFFCPYHRHLVTAVRLSFWLEYKNGKNVLHGGVAFIKTPWALRLASTMRPGDRFCITFSTRGRKGQTN